jgi:hypothetical protein
MATSNVSNFVPFWVGKEAAKSNMGPFKDDIWLEE